MCGRYTDTKRTFPVARLHGLASNPVMKEGLPGRNARARAFTLIELLVVVAIIALLASLLLPGLSKTKTAARAAACRNNLRQVHLTLAMYVAEFNAYPPASGVFGLSRSASGFELHPLVWNSALAIHSDILGATAGGIYSCPEAVKYRTPSIVSQSAGTSTTLVAATDTVGTLEYGYNASGTATAFSGSLLGLGENLLPGFVIREQTVQSPAEMIAFGDSQGGQVIPVISPASEDTKPPQRHNGKANLNFCDGHTEVGKPAQWTANTETARSRWNNDSQPHF
jgi:prepilin-type N-terminal cleavage/methylation domain-containing protein/prepilin-type processing-associated H-X9-DG protein